MGNLEQPSRAYLDNVLMNTHVIEAARASGVRKVVAMGSAAIYSDLAELPMSEDDIWRGAPHDSEAPYAHAKRAMLAQLETYQRHDGLDFAYAVSTNLYGPHDRFDEQWGHVIPSLVSKFHRAVTTGEPVVVWGTGTPTRDLLFSRDAASALRTMAECGSGAFNLATGRSHTIREVVNVLAGISGYAPREVVWDASKPDGQRLRSYDVSRLQSFGFAPHASLQSGLEQTYDWYAEHARCARH